MRRITAAYRFQRGAVLAGDEIEVGLEEQMGALLAPAAECIRSCGAEDVGGDARCAGRGHEGRREGGHRPADSEVDAARHSVVDDLRDRRRDTVGVSVDVATDEVADGVELLCQRGVDAVVGLSGQVAFVRRGEADVLSLPMDILSRIDQRFPDLRARSEAS